MEHNSRGGRRRPPEPSPQSWDQQQQQAGMYYMPMPMAYYSPDYMQQQQYAMWAGCSQPYHPVMSAPAYPCPMMQQQQQWGGPPPPPPTTAKPPPPPPQQQDSPEEAAGAPPSSQPGGVDDLVESMDQLAVVPPSSTSAAAHPRHPSIPPPQPPTGPPPQHWHPHQQQLAPTHYIMPPPQTMGPMLQYGHYPQQYSQQQHYSQQQQLGPYYMPDCDLQQGMYMARDDGPSSSFAPSQPPPPMPHWGPTPHARTCPAPRRRGLRMGASTAVAVGGWLDSVPQTPCPPPPCPEDAPDVIIDCCGSDNESDGEGPSASASAPMSPNYEISGTSEDWRSLTEGLLQKIISRLGGEDVKKVRLVGRHWRAVADHNLEQLSPSSMQSAVIVTRFRNLKALHLTNCANVRNRDLMIIARSGLRLHTLTLGDDTTKPWVTNKGLAYIAQMPTLTALHLQDCNSVTNNGIARLNALQGLSSLSLKGCRKLTNSGLEPLQDNKALTSLNLFGCVKIGDKGLAPLTALRLVTLTLGLTRIKDEGVGYLASITSLQELSFSHEEVTDTGLKQLSSLTNLQSLALREIRSVSGEALVEVVPQLSSLQSLDLFRNWGFSDDHMLRCLDSVGSVTSLDLRGTSVTQEGINQLTQLPSLQKLCVQPPHVDQWEPYLLVLANLTQLVSLTINNCTVLSMRLLGSLRPLNRLLELDLSDDKFLDGLEPREQVQQQHIEVMASLSSLTSLDLSRRPIGEEHLAVLAERLPRLRSLIVVGCPVHNDELESLQRRFPALAIHRKPLLEGSNSSASSEIGF